MQRSGRQQIIYVLAILFAAGPVVAGLIRAYSANDARLLWMALVAFVGVSIIVGGRSRAQGPGISVGRAVLAFVVGVIVTVLITQTFIGATSFVGVGAVAVVLSFFWTMAYVLHAMSRAPAH
jgi:hypothetical protein